MPSAALSIIFVVLGVFTMMFGVIAFLAGALSLGITVVFVSVLIFILGAMFRQTPISKYGTATAQNRMLYGRGRFQGTQGLGNADMSSIRQNSLQGRGPFGASKFNNNINASGRPMRNKSGALAPLVFGVMLIAAGSWIGGIALLIAAAAVVFMPFLKVQPTQLRMQPIMAFSKKPDGLG